MSNEPIEKGLLSPRANLAANQIRWAFGRWPPVDALEFFIARAGHGDLAWPITHMLDVIDHPSAVAFVAEKMAAVWRPMEGTQRFAPWPTLLHDQWRRVQEKQGRPMSPASRERLLTIWRDGSGDKHLRRAAFGLWSATEDEGDLEILQGAAATPHLEDQILGQGLRLGDPTAVPGLIEKLKDTKSGWRWWCHAYRIWSPALTEVLDDTRDGGHPGGRKRLAMSSTSWLLTGTITGSIAGSKNS